MGTSYDGKVREKQENRTAIDNLICLIEVEIARLIQIAVFSDCWTQYSDTVSAFASEVVAES